MMHPVPRQVKIMTLWVRLSDATLYVLSLATAYMVLITHGRPSPRKTFTLLLPKTNKFGISIHVIIHTSSADKI